MGGGLLRMMGGMESPNHLSLGTQRWDKILEPEEKETIKAKWGCAHSHSHPQSLQQGSDDIYKVPRKQMVKCRK